MTSGTLSDLSAYLTEGYWSDTSGYYRKWNLSDTGINAKSGEITYSLGSNWYDTNGINSNHATLINYAFQYLENITGINFTETSDGSSADIAFGNEEVGAFAGFDSANYDLSGPNQIYINTAYVNIDPNWFSSSPTKNDYVYQTILHEIGHLLGLGHQSNYNGSASFPTDADFDNDCWSNSIMSYFSQIENTNIDADYAYLQTLMAVDFLALDALYGDQSYGGTTFGTSNAFAEDTTYGFNTTISASDHYALSNLAENGDENTYCIVDGGGNDTLDCSGWSADQLINLTVTSSSNTAPTTSNIAGLTGNLTLAVNTVIENAIGGSGNDTITGNQYSNYLDGGDGDDQLYGFDGDDVFDWDSSARNGSDTFYGGAGDDLYIIGTYGVDTIVELDGEGDDSVQTFSSYTLSNYVENLTLLGSADINGHASFTDAVANTMTGNSGNNQLVGYGGNDTLYGGAGIDTLYGGDGTDYLFGEGGDDDLYGGDDGDFFYLSYSYGADVIWDFDESIDSLYIYGEDGSELSESEYSISYNSSGFRTYTLSDQSSLTLYQIYNNDPTGSLAISGTETEGSTLSLSDTIADEDGIDADTVSYQWLRDGSAISGATGISYTLTQDDVGAVITAKQSYTDDFGNDHIVTSAATSAIVNVNDAPVVRYEVDAYSYNLTELGVEFEATGTLSMLGEQAASLVFSYVYSGEYDDYISGDISIITSGLDLTSLDYNGASISLNEIEAFGAQSLLADTQEFSVAYLGFNEMLTTTLPDRIAFSLDETGPTITNQEEFYSWLQVALEAQETRLQTLDPEVEYRFADLPNFRVISPISIEGDAIEGSSLSAVVADWIDPDGTTSSVFSYQWLRDGSAIDGATSSTYVLSQADVGSEIALTVSYTDDFGTYESATSSATSSISNINDAPTGVVTISGTAAEDQTLTLNSSVADEDGIDADTVSYQWYRDGSIISGATGTSYTLTQDDVGAVITAKQSYTDDFGNDHSVTSAATSSISNINDAPTGSVTITGTATEGSTLSLSDTIADADGLGSFSYYQWLRNGSFILETTSTTYVLTQDDVGKNISASVTYTDDYGTEETVTSSATSSISNINDAPTGVVTISGTAAEDQTLTLNSSVADEDGIDADTVSYQWLRNGSAISGATSSTYVLTQDDVGTNISASVSYTDGYGTVETVTSSGTGEIDYGPNVVSESSFDLSGLDNSYNLTLSGSGDYDGYGNGNDNSIIGNIGANTLKGYKGDDVLYGKSGNDRLYGNGNDDKLYGGSGDDLLKGGSGFDLLKGGSGFDLLKGGSGDDILKGGSGNDKLYGGSGDDILKGGVGGDILRGDAGKDTMVGGGGADMFVFRKASDSSASYSKADTIKGFKQGQDQIDLHFIDASTKLSGNNAFTFDGTTSFGTSSEGDIYFKQFNNAGTANDYTMVYIDTDNDRDTEMSIKIKGLHNLVADDFIL